MRILITVETYTPLIDGVQTITSQYAEFLAKQKHEVTVVTGRHGYLPEKDIINGVKVIRVNMYTKKSIYVGDKKGYIQLITELARENDVMVNVCLQTAFSDCLLKHLDKFACKKVLYMHGMAHFDFPKVEQVDFHDILSWGLNVVRWRTMYNNVRKYLSAYDSIIHLHQNDKTVELVDGLSVQNHIFENTLSWDYYKEEPAVDAPFLSVSNYMHDKNQEYVLKSYYLSKSKRNLIFVGSQESKYLERLKRLKKLYDENYGHKNVEFIVGEDREITHKRFMSAYAFIFGSKSEKYPVVICEAMRNGIPYISTDVGIVRYLAGGIVVKSIDEMAEMINYIDEYPEKRNELGNAGLQYAKEHQNFTLNSEEFEMMLKKLM